MKFLVINPLHIKVDHDVLRSLTKPQLVTLREQVTKVKKIREMFTTEPTVPGLWVRFEETNDFWTLFHNQSAIPYVIESINSYVLDYAKKELEERRKAKGDVHIH